MKLYNVGDRIIVTNPIASSRLYTVGVITKVCAFNDRVLYTLDNGLLFYNYEISKFPSMNCPEYLK